MFRQRILISAAVVAVVVFNLGATRKWTDSTGKSSTEAEFVELVDGKVVLKKVDGKVIQVPLERLSQTDQNYVRRVVAEREKKPAPPKSVRPGKPVQPEPTAEVGSWPEWRGPKRDGICRETGLLQAWPPEGPPLAWQVEGLGRGYASVSVHNGRIYTLGKLGNTTKLVCLDESDGRELWSTDVGSGGDAPNCTPTFDPDSGLIFAVSHRGDLLCADDKGNAVWTKNFERDFGGKMMSSWGFSESPLVDGPKLVCTPGADDAMLAALDKRTGRPIWSMTMPAAGRAGKDGAAYSSIVIGHGGGVKQYVQLIGRGVIGVDAETGTPLWGYNRIANGTANCPTPLISGDFVFCSTGYGDGGSALLEIKRQGRELTAREVYYKPANELQNHHGGMVMLGKHIFLGHGHNNGFPVCLEWETGKKKWDPGRGPGRASAAVLYADGHLYFRYEDGTMALIEANPQDYRVKGSFRLISNRDKSWPHPVIANGRLYLRDQEVLMCYDVRRK